MGLGNNQWYFDDMSNYYIEYTAGSQTGVLAAGISSSNITHQSNYSGPPITNCPNPAGYQGWGTHNTIWPGSFPIASPPYLTIDGNWYLLSTIESYNGIQNSGQSNYFEWFQTNAFGGTNYSNTPIGAVGHTAEPGLYGIESQIYFENWAYGLNLADAAWSGRLTQNYIVLGDPVVRL